MGTKELFDTILGELKTRHTIDASTLGMTSKLNYEKELKAYLDQRLRSEPTHQKRITAEFLGAGPLTSLLDDPDVTEIIINGPENIQYESLGRMLSLEDSFLSSITFKNFIHKVCAECNTKIDAQTPFMDGKWNDFRCHIAISPISSVIATCTFRKHPKSPWTLCRLEQSGWADSEGIEIIKTLVRNKKNLLIIGPTGSGKTSILNACLQHIDNSERAIIIEDTDEIHCPNPNSVKLLTRPGSSSEIKEIDQQELLRNSLRMRPQRIVVGEVRDKEAKDLILCLSSGHAGGLATIHASSPKQAIWRLELLTLLGAPQWPRSAIRELIGLGIDYVICTEQVDGLRRLKEISKISVIDQGNLTFESVWPIRRLSQNSPHPIRQI